MKKKFSSMWRLALTLVMVLSLNLVTAAPALAADDYESGTKPFDIEVVTDPVSPEDGDVPTITVTVSDADGDAVSGIGVTLVGLSDFPNQRLVSPDFTEFTGIQSADINATENYPGNGMALLTQATTLVEPGGSGTDMGRGINDVSHALTLRDVGAGEHHFMILAFGDGTDFGASIEYDVLYFVNLDDGEVYGSFDIDTNNDGNVDADVVFNVSTSGVILEGAVTEGSVNADVDYEIDPVASDLTTATYNIDHDGGGDNTFDGDFTEVTLDTSIDSGSGIVKIGGEVTMDDGGDANDFWFLLNDPNTSGTYDEMFIVQKDVGGGEFADVLQQVASGDVFDASNGNIGNVGVLGGTDFKIEIASDGTVSILDDILLNNVWVETYLIANSGTADGGFILETALPLPAGASYDAIIVDSGTSGTFDQVYFDVDRDGEVGDVLTTDDRVEDETDTLDWWVQSVALNAPIVLKNSTTDATKIVDGGVVVDVVSQLPASADNTWFASDTGEDGTMDAGGDVVDLNGTAGSENLVLVTIPAGSSKLKVYVSTDVVSTNSWEEGPFVIGDDVRVDFVQNDPDDVYATLISEKRAAFRVDDTNGDEGAPIVDIAKTGSSGQVQFLNTVVHGAYPVYSDDGEGNAIEALISVSEVMDLSVSTDITGLSWGQSEFITVTTQLDGTLVDGTDPDFWDGDDPAPMAGSDDAEAGDYANTLYHNASVGPTTIRLYKPLPDGSAAVDATGDVVEDVVGNPLAIYQVSTKQITSNGKQVFQIDATSAGDAGIWTFVVTLEYDANGNSTDDPGELHRGITYVTVEPEEDALVEVQPSSLIQNMPTTLTIDTGVDADGDGEIGAGEEADNAIVSFDGAGFKYQTSFELVLDQTDVSDFSSLPLTDQNPNNVYRWASFNEASQGLDFNHDGDKTDTWYVVAYDSGDGENFNRIAIGDDLDFSGAGNIDKAVGATLTGFDVGNAEVFAIAPDGSSVHLGTPDGLGLDPGQYQIDLAAGEISGIGTIDVEITSADGAHIGSTTMTATEAGVLNVFTSPSEIPAATSGTTLDVTILDGDGNEVALQTIEVSGPGIDRTYDSNLSIALIGSVTGVDGQVRLGDGNIADGEDGAVDSELFAYQAGTLTITVTDADDNVSTIDVPITGYLVSVDTTEVPASGDGSVETDILVTVTDTEGTPLNNAQVWIGFDNTGNKIIDGSDANKWNVDGAVVNINNGEYTVTVSPTQAGLITVTVENSTDSVMASLYEAIESVGAPTLSLTSDTAVITAGMLNEFQVTVLDADGDPLTGLVFGDFDFSGDFTEGTDITDSDAVTEMGDGVYKFTDIVPTATGTLTVRARSGLDYGTVDISAEAPQVSLNLTTITTGISETTTIEVTVKDALGNDVINARVQPAPSIVNTNPATDEVNDSSVATIQNEDATVTYIDALPIGYSGDDDAETLAPVVGDFVDLIDNNDAEQNSKILDLDADEEPDHAAYVNNGGGAAAIPVTGDDSKVVFTVTGVRSGDLRFLVGNSTGTFMTDYEEDVLVDAAVVIENPALEVTDLAGQSITAVIVGQLQNFVITVTDVSGEPVAEQEVELHDVAAVESMDGATVKAFGSTDENGEVTLSYMPTGTGADRIKFTTPELRSATPKIALATVDVVVTEEVLESIAASPESVTLDVDVTQQLTVTATYNDTSTDDVTTEASYESSNTSVATVSAGGLITGVAVGSATVTVSYTENGITETAVVSVTVEAAPDDILAYYRAYSGDPDVVETTDLLKAANDWANAMVPPDFTEPISTTQLLVLANEWAATE